MGPSGHFYSHMDPVWSLLIVGTGFVPWVELLVQRRLYPIFMSGAQEMGRHIAYLDTTLSCLSHRDSFTTILKILPKTMSQ